MDTCINTYIFTQSDVIYVDLAELRKEVEELERKQENLRKADLSVKVSELNNYLRKSVNVQEGLSGVVKGRSIPDEYFEVSRNGGVIVNTRKGLSSRLRGENIPDEYLEVGCNEGSICGNEPHKSKHRG